MKHSHDLIVIGAGSGGLGAAGFGGALGLKVALIDRTEKNFGGDCLNYGCVPSKALLHVASLFQKGREAEAFGFSTDGKADFSRVMEWVHARQDTIRAHESPAFLAEEWGLETIIGTAELTGRHEVSVNGRRLTAPKIVLATGSLPRQLDVPGMEKVQVYDNESLFWELEVLPDHLLVVGGGPIGCEMAQAFRRLGSRVTIVNRGKRLLAGDPPKMAGILEAKLLAEGIVVKHETEVSSFSSARVAVLSDGIELDCSHVLVAIGRRVRTEGLGLAAAGVETKGGKIITDEKYRTTNPDIYAVGDAYGREMFSHGAEAHNIDLWNNLLSPLKKKHSLEHFTWVTFTDPEIASFGWTKRDLDEKNIKYTTEEIPLDHDDRAIAADYAYGHLTLYLSEGGWWSGPKLLGGCMAAPAAGEMIQELHLMNQLGLPLGKLTNKIYAYPVGSRINQKAARDRTQGQLLTETNKRLARWWYRLLRSF